MLVGGGFGAVAARKVKMTAMPQMVALFNGVGGGAAALIALAELHRILPEPGRADRSTSALAIALSALIGSISFAGSMVAFAKLQELIGGRPITYPGQKIVNARPARRARRARRRARRGRPGRSGCSGWSSAARSLFGVLFVLPIGGADMPVVISLLNAFTGLAVAVGGFELENNVLIVERHARRRLRHAADAADGAGDEPLDRERPLRRVRPGDAAAAAVAAGDGGTVRSATAEDVAVMLAYAQKVVFVPGYGLAVAQAQHDVRQLADLLEAKGVEVTYAIHPVAGRMPGHMNVLLAEANVPYPQLKEMDEANPEFSRTDVAVVVGANDVVNPDARNNQGSPIYGMPILERRRRAGGRRAQALDEPRLRRDREPALPQPEDGDALRRREGRRSTKLIPDVKTL